MTQSSTSRNTRTSGLRRPALALAFGTAAVASALAPVASMAATAPVPTYNDSTKTLGSTLDKKPALIPATILTAMPATPMPTVVTGTINGDVNQQAILAANASASVKTSYAAMVAKYNAWKVARTPVVTAYLAWKNAPAVTTAQKTAKAAKYKVYLAKVAAFNKAGGAAKYTAYKTAFTAYNVKFTPAFATAKTAVKANHFKLAAKTNFSANCTSADNRTAAQLGARSGVENGPSGSPGAGYALWCDVSTGTLNYFLPDKDNQGTPGWETFTEKITTNPATGAVTGLDFATDATGTSLNTYIKFTIHTPVTTWLATHPLKATTKADFSKFVTKALNDSGAATVDGSPNVGGTNTCISVASSATLTCQAFTASLQSALTASVKGMPY